MVNASEPGDPSALHSRIRKFDFHLGSGGGEAGCSETLVGWGPATLPIPNPSAGGPRGPKAPPAWADLSPSRRAGAALSRDEGAGDGASHVGRDGKLHTNTLHSHVPLRGGGFYCYVKGCVCIGNKTRL